MSAQVRLDAVTVAVGRFLTSPVCGATPQTAVIFVVIRRYSSGLLNFVSRIR